MKRVIQIIDTHNMIRQFVNIGLPDRWCYRLTFTRHGNRNDWLPGVTGFDLHD